METDQRARHFLSDATDAAWEGWQAALTHKGRVVPVSVLEELAHLWESGGWRTGADYVTALQECADQLRAIIEKEVL